MLTYQPLPKPIDLQKLSPIAPVDPVEKQTFTPEQDAVLVEGYPAGRPTSELIAAVNALPGFHVTRDKQIRHRVAKLHIQRPEWYVAQAQADALETRLARGESFSSEQDAVLSAGYTAGHSMEALKEAINAVPGGIHVTKDGQIINRAKRLHLHRPNWYQPEYKPATINTTKSFTTAQDVVLEEGYCAGRSFDVLMAALNDLPGKHIVSHGQIRNRAERLKLHRPDWYQAFAKAQATKTRSASGKQQKQKQPESLDHPEDQPVRVFPRELIRFAAELNLPRDSDAAAVSNAARKVHPEDYRYNARGYTVVSAVPPPMSMWKAKREREYS